MIVIVIVIGISWISLEHSGCPISSSRDTTKSSCRTGSLPNANQATISLALNPAVFANSRSLKEDSKENNNPDVDSRSTGS
ncbi:hypothetical protein E2320_022715 [Naja naja]|nr:hypothetical protein E2320_022715 [Naja naja]